MNASTLRETVRPWFSCEPLWKTNQNNTVHTLGEKLGRNSHAALLRFGAAAEPICWLGPLKQPRTSGVYPLLQIGTANSRYTNRYTIALYNQKRNFVTTAHWWGIKRPYRPGWSTSRSLYLRIQIPNLRTRAPMSNNNQTIRTAGERIIQASTYQPNHHTKTHKLTQ